MHLASGPLSPAHVLVSPVSPACAGDRAASLSTLAGDPATTTHYYCHTIQLPWRGLLRNGARRSALDSLSPHVWRLRSATAPAFCRCDCASRPARRRHRRGGVCALSARNERAQPSTARWGGNGVKGAHDGADAERVDAAARMGTRDAVTAGFVGVCHHLQSPWKDRNGTASSHSGSARREATLTGARPRTPEHTCRMSAP